MMGIYPLVIKETEKILIVAPHPDDESIGTGGLLSLYSNQCDVIVMTDGRYGNTEIPPDQMREIRKKEFCQAMKKAGPHQYILCDLEDGKLILHEKYFREIDFSRYTFIFLPNPKDNHSDHMAAYLYTVNEIKRRNIKNIKVFQYEVHTPLPDATCYLDISTVIEKKQELVACHSSQMKVHSYVQQVRILAQYRGYQNEQPDKFLEVYTEVKLEERQITAGTEFELSKYKQFTRVLLKWIDIRNSGKSIADFMKGNGYCKAAVYGYGPIGKLLYEELKKAGCDIPYIVDKNPALQAENIHIYHDMENLKKVDVIIVTAMSHYEDIAKEIRDHTDINVVSLEKIIMSYE